MQEALAERVLQEVIVPDLDEVDEHGALALALVRYQHPGLKKSRVSVIQDMRCKIRCKKKTSEFVDLNPLLQAYKNIFIKEANELSYCLQKYDFFFSQLTC